jgi:hypothetical protein
VEAPFARPSRVGWSGAAYSGFRIVVARSHCSRVAFSLRKRHLSLP